MMDADFIAKLCYDHYDKLPKKGKPQTGKEWTLMAAVVQQIVIGEYLTLDHSTLMNVMSLITYII